MTIHLELSPVLGHMINNSSLALIPHVANDNHR